MYIYNNIKLLYTITFRYIDRLSHTITITITITISMARHGIPPPWRKGLRRCRRWDQHGVDGNPLRIGCCDTVDGPAKSCTTKSMAKYG